MPPSISIEAIVPAGENVPDSSEVLPPEYLVLGIIVAPFGVRGEVKVLLDTDFPELVLDATHLYLGEPPVLFQVEWARMHKGMVRLKVAGCDDRNAAEFFRKQLVQIKMEEAPIPGEGEYYYHQLLDLEVWTDEGECLGQVVDIWSIGSNEVILVRGRQGEILLPAVESVVREVDLDAGRLFVHLLEGLR
jgi:16S rRNA processing protein RimM